MAIPFKSNIDVPSNWKLTYDNGMSVISLNTEEILVAGAEKPLRLGSSYGVSITFNSSQDEDGIRCKVLNGTPTIDFNSDQVRFGYLTGTDVMMDIGTFAVNATNISLNSQKGLSIKGSTGTSGQVLTSNGNSGAPTWQDNVKIFQVHARFEKGNYSWPIIDNYFTAYSKILDGEIGVKQQSTDRDLILALYKEQNPSSDPGFPVNGWGYFDEYSTSSPRGLCIRAYWNNYKEDSTNIYWKYCRLNDDGEYQVTYDIKDTSVFAEVKMSYTRVF